MSLPDPDLSRAVFVGVGNYLNSPEIPQIPAIKNNITDLVNVFTSRRHWGLPTQNCVILSDPSEPSEVATAIAQAADLAADTLIVYLAAHGMVSVNGELVIATRNTNPRWPQFTGLRYSWVREALRASLVKRKIVIIDCCFSGRAISAMSANESVVEGQLDIRGAYILASAPPNATAIAYPGERHTAFTGSLIELLRDGVSPGPAYLELDHIYQFLRKAMIRAGYPQPTQVGTDSVSRLSVVRNTAVNFSSRADIPPNVEFRAPILQTVGSPELDEYGTVVESAILMCIRIDNDDRSRLGQLDAQIRFVDLLQRSANGIELEVSGALRKPFPAGEILLIPESLADSDRMIAFIKRIRQELVIANRGLSRSLRTRMRLAAIKVPEYRGGSQILSGDVARASLRLLESAAIQQATVAREISFVLLISTEIVDTAREKLPETEIQSVPADAGDARRAISNPRYYRWAPID